MAVHYYHCTDGVDLVVDRRGLEARAPRDVRAGATSAVDALRRAVPDYDEWANWSVYVYDSRGEVEILPFDEIALRAPAARADVGQPGA